MTWLLLDPLILPGSLHALEELRLQGNRLSGALPGAAWGRGMSNLRELDLSGKCACKTIMWLWVMA